MSLTTKSAILNFFSEIEPSMHGKYKLGVVDFVSKLEQLITAMEVHDTKKMSFLLHSLRPLSAYLNLNKLNDLLHTISYEDSSKYAEQIEQIKTHIADINTAILPFG